LLPETRPSGGTEVAVLTQNWARLVALPDDRPDPDPVTRSLRLCTLCVETTAVSGAALGTSADGRRSTICATDDVSNRLEDLQITHSEGPCVDALGQGWPVLVGDLSDGGRDRRWPRFASAAVDLGAHAYFSLPLRLGAIRLGVLSLYRTVPGELTTERLHDAATLADAAVLLLAIAQADPTAEAWLWTLNDRTRFRAEVHQAVGALIVQLGLSAGDAFARLCGQAYATDTPIAQVAADIMSGRLRLERD
jgi:hypothetical protein